MDQLLSSETVRQILDISSATLWRRVQSGQVPPPRRIRDKNNKIGSRNYWLKSEIDAVVRSLEVPEIYQSLMRVQSCA